MRRLVAVGAGWGWAAVASRRGGRRSPGPDYEGIYYAKFYGHGRVLAGEGVVESEKKNLTQKRKTTPKKRIFRV